MTLKTLSLIAASALLGVTGAYAQASGAASTGTSSNGSAETAARPGPTTARLTRGSGPTDSSMSTGGRRHHHRHHGRRHHRHHHKAGMNKATPKPASSGQ